MVRWSRILRITIASSTCTIVVKTPIPKNFLTPSVELIKYLVITLHNAPLRYTLIKNALSCQSHSPSTKTIENYNLVENKEKYER